MGVFYFSCAAPRPCATLATMINDPELNRFLENPEASLHELRKMRRDAALSRETWKLFKILSEFVDGFDMMSRVGPAVSIFGSARTTPDRPEYKLAQQVAAKFVHAKLGVITGGGPGIMEAANKGAFEAKGKSVGLNIVLPFEQQPNIYQKYKLEFQYFFIRKVMFVKYSVGFVVFPGGFGTMDELFEALTLIQTRKVQKFPVVLVGTKFWTPLLGWIRHTMAEEYKTISPEDMDLFIVTDDPDEAVRAVLSRFDLEAWRSLVRPALPGPRLADTEPD